MSPLALDLWTRVSLLPVPERAEILARLAEDVGRAAINGALGLEFLVAARARHDQDGTVQATEPAAPSMPPPVRADGRRRTTRLPRPAQPPQAGPHPHQQYPRAAADAAMRNLP